MNQREVGTRQESRAAEYLESLGYHILVRNFRCRFGEIDLIAKQDDTYIFIEVKYRTGRTAGDPTSAVDGKKQKKNFKNSRLLPHAPPDPDGCALPLRCRGRDTGGDPRLCERVLLSGERLVGREFL